MHRGLLTLNTHPAFVLETPLSPNAFLAFSVFLAFYPETIMALQKSEPEKEVELNEVPLNVTA